MKPGSSKPSGRPVTAGNKEKNRYPPISQAARHEIGGIIERAFSTDGGPVRAEIGPGYLRTISQETWERASLAGKLAAEADRAVEVWEYRYALSKNPADLLEKQRWELKALAYHREAQQMQHEAERLRRFL